MLPLRLGETLELAMAIPTDEFAIRALEFAYRRKITPRVAIWSDIEDAWRRLYRDEDSNASLLPPSSGVSIDVERLKELAGDAPVIRYVDRLISDAFEAGASDIHLDAGENGLDLRLRIDGILHSREGPPAHMGAAVVSRLKVLASLDIAERRIPQDGRIRFTANGRNIDLRIATSPSIFGESLVLRLLDWNDLPDSFSALGMSKTQALRFERVIAQPHGIVLVTGPTGSGKTTTLYTALQLLNQPKRKILSVEDPVEYNLPRIGQVQVVPKIGLTFATAIRSFLRQDPDIIMVGEIRDHETAEAAIQASLTGHLVLSTLHTNSAAAAVPRLLDMGVEDFLLASTLSAVVAQRLVRKLCQQCRMKTEIPPALAERLARLGYEVPKEAWRAIGCPACNGTGYRGRLAIVELIEATPVVRSCFRAGVTADEILLRAKDHGFQSMVEDGLEKAFGGETTIEEVFRVTKDQ